jgi:hypothetical protein
MATHHLNHYAVFIFIILLFISVVTYRLAQGELLKLLNVGHPSYVNCGLSTFSIVKNRRIPTAEPFTFISYVMLNVYQPCVSDDDI